MASFDFDSFLLLWSEREFFRISCENFIFRREWGQPVAQRFDSDEAEKDVNLMRHESRNFLSTREEVGERKTRVGLPFSILFSKRDSYTKNI